VIYKKEEIANMEKAAIVYGSVTGFTEEVAYALAHEIEDKYDVSIIDAIEFEQNDLKSAHMILLGSSTWGVGQIQMDMLPVNEAVKRMDLKGKKAAVFGTGDSSYKKFAQAVITLEKTLKSAGAEIIQKGYRCDKLWNDEAKSKLKEWASKL
jgi:flavodoxin I